MTKSLQRLPHATPAQLQRAADVDLWRGGASGVDARFDAERFAEWLEVLVDAGSDITTRQLSAMDLDLVAVGIAEHVRVFDGATRPSMSSANEVELGGYIVVPRRGRAVQSILDTLASLHDEDPPYFHRVMAACRRLSNEGYEIDGLDDLLTPREQAMFDLASARERRREEHGFVSAADARAFLAASGEGRRALFRAHVRDSSDAPSAAAAGAPPTSAEVFVDDTEPTPQPPRALLGAGATGSTRLARFHALLAQTMRRDDATAAMRLQELGFLANTIAAGCSVQGRAPTPIEASEAAASVCNLALDIREDSADTNLLELFDVGWAEYRRVCLIASERLLDCLARLECHDEDLQRELHELRTALTRHHRDGAPWRARNALDILTRLDLAAWAALVGLIAECPVVHAAVPAVVERRRGGIDPAAFAFLSERRQIDTVQQFLARLPELLTGT